jgi:hypothetical protein
MAHDVSAGDEVLWSETVHGLLGRYEPARLVRRGGDGLLELHGSGQSVLDMDDARSLFAALGEALQR